MSLDCITKDQKLLLACTIFCLVGTFIFLNVLTPVALGKSVPLYYPKIMAKSSLNGDFKMCLYWATAIIAFLLNTFYTANSIRHHIFRNQPAITSSIIHLNYPCSIPSDTNVYHTSNSRECMGVNGEALQLHAVYKKPYLLLQVTRESVSVQQVT